MNNDPHAATLTAIERYYQFHSKIYDATRWSFLFGRQAMIDILASDAAPSNILEIGCGTGFNLVRLCAAFPAAALTAVDLSPAMIAKARTNLGDAAGRVNFLLQAYDAPVHTGQPFDLVLCSYSLTMFNPGWEQAIDTAAQDLRPGGRIAVVDFHDSPVVLYQRWMQANHVRMNGHLLPRLVTRFQRCALAIRPAYGGLWSYLLFIGKKKDSVGWEK